jgi:hypothetical protein
MFDDNIPEISGMISCDIWTTVLQFLTIHVITFVRVISKKILQIVKNHKFNDVVIIKRDYDLEKLVQCFSKIQLKPRSLNNDFINIDPTILCKISNNVIAYRGRCDITLEVAKKLTNIVSLCARSDVNDEILLNLPNLKELIISRDNQNITGNSLTTLSNLTSLLIREKNLIVDENLETLTQIEQIGIFGDNITVDGLHKLPKLIDLTIKNNNDITVNDLISLTNVKKLLLCGGNKDLDDLSNLTNLTSLTSLKIHENYNFTLKKSLEFLNLSTIKELSLETSDTEFDIDAIDINNRTINIYSNITDGIPWDELKKNIDIITHLEIDRSFAQNVSDDTRNFFANKGFNI